MMPSLLRSRVVLAICSSVLTLTGIALVTVAHHIREVINEVVPIDELLQSVSSSGPDGSKTGPDIDVDGLIEPVKTVLTSAGAVLAVVGVLGLIACGLILKPLLISNCGITGLLLLALATLFILVAINSVEQKIADYLEALIMNEYQGIEDTSRAGLILNYIMITEHCCGLEPDEYAIFSKAKVWKSSRTISKEVLPGITISVDVTLKIPVACCRMKGKFPAVSPLEETCPVNPSDQNSYWRTGCLAKVYTIIEAYKGYVYGGLFFFIVVIVNSLLATASIIRSLWRGEVEAKHTGERFLPTTRPAWYLSGEWHTKDVKQGRGESGDKHRGQGENGDKHRRRSRSDREKQHRNNSGKQQRSHEHSQRENGKRSSHTLNLEVTE